MNKIYVVYHQVAPAKEGKPAIDCPDGVCSAWIAHRGLLSWGFNPENIYVLGDSYRSPDTEYSLENPPVVLQLVTSLDTVVLVDFSYPLPVMKQLHSIAARVILLDHHVPRLRDISEFMSMYNLQDVEKECGSTLAWKFFFPFTVFPWFLKSVRDRDINPAYYAGELPESEAIAEKMSSDRRGLDLPEVFQFFDDLLKMDPVESVTYLTEGLVDVRRRNEIVDEAVRLAVQQGIPTTKVGEWTVPFYRITDPKLDRFISILGARLHRALPDAPFIAISSSSNDNTISLRSHSGSNIHLGELAKTLGGGGHAHAAGFQLPLKKC